MKILLLVYGEYRGANIATKTWNILNRDVDVLIHTQSESRYNVAKKNIFSNKNIQVEDLKNLFGECNVYLESIDEYTRTNPNDDINLNIRSFRFLYKKISDVILDYDIVAISRLDSTFYIHDLDKFIKEYDTDTLYVNETVQQRKEGNFIQDHCYIGSSKIIDRFLKNLPDTIIDSHHEIGDYVLNNFKHDVWDGFSSIHLRMNMHEIFENFFSTNGSIKNNDIEYRDFFSRFMQETHLNLEREIK